MTTILDYHAGMVDTAGQDTIDRDDPRRPRTPTEGCPDWVSPGVPSRPAWIGRSTRRRPRKRPSQSVAEQQGHAPAGVTVVSRGTPLEVPPDLSLVVTVHNQRDDLERFLGDLPDALGGRSAQVLVVDRDSKDRTTTLILNQHPGVTLLRTAADLGPSWSLDIGLSRAQAKIVILARVGMRPTRAALNSLITHVETHPECGVAAAGLLDEDGSPLAGSAHFPTLRHLLVEFSAISRLMPNNRWRRTVHSLDEDSASGHAVDCAPAGLLVLRHEVLDEVGPFDTSLARHFHVLDWYRRMQRAGYEVHLLSDVRMICRPGDPLNTAKIYQLHRDRIRFARKHHGKWGVRCATVALWSWALVEAGSRLLRRGDTGRVGVGAAIEALTEAARARAQA
jgi:GT2 family glycosyltransferase